MRLTDGILYGLFALLLIISGCGDDSQEAQQADYEEALFFSYATTKSGEYMNDIAINDMIGVVTVLQFMVTQYYMDKGNLPTSINLSDPDIIDYVPPGMTGTLSTDGTSKVTAHLTLEACFLDVNKTKEYTGTFNADGVFSIEAGGFTLLNINAPSLTIAYTGKSYAKAVYSSLTIGIDNTDSFPDYTLTGSIIVDDKGYSYASLLYKQTSSTALTVSGTFTISGMEFEISGSPTLDPAGVWTSGTVTLTNADATVTVALNGTTASFSMDDGTEWETDDWYLDRLVP